MGIIAGKLNHLIIADRRKRVIRWAVEENSERSLALFAREKLGIWQTEYWWRDDLQVFARTGNAGWVREPTKLHSGEFADVTIDGTRYKVVSYT